MAHQAVDLMAIQVILVPAGAEYQAVMRGIKAVPEAPSVISIPAGPAAFRAFLESWEGRSRYADQEILLMGLGGSLSPQHQIGDAILLESVWNAAGGDGFQCDRALTESLAQWLKVPMGTGVMCDRVITTVAEKRRLGDRYRANVVDMESAVLLEAMPQAKVAILRVISDDCSRDLPDLAGAIGSDGSLRADTLARSFLKRPIAALNFISGSLQALRTLEQITLMLFKSDQ
ncbi:phosphorylase [filamentous cyanobacterium CCT1]|nr:phosphorylase [filamentous cyanobacterium CCT1]PSN81519.1 phosphorylase [filamentous cyanobacterium CCP4]